MRGHGFAEGVDRFGIEGPRQRFGPQGLDRRRRDVFVDGMDDVGAAHEVIDERLDEDGCFGADDVGAEDEFRLLVDDQFDEAVVFIARSMDDLESIVATLKMGRAA